MLTRTTASIAALAGAIALAGCATLEQTAASAVGTTYRANLTGAQEVGGGDPDGSAQAEITLEKATNQVCWNVHDVRNIGEVTMAHIHSGAAGVNGPPVLTLSKNSEGTWRGCVNQSMLGGADIRANPGAFYVNLHTADYPNGALRGQLM